MRALGRFPRWVVGGGSAQSRQRIRCRWRFSAEPHELHASGYLEQIGAETCAVSSPLGTCVSKGTFRVIDCCLLRSGLAVSVQGTSAGNGKHANPHRPVYVAIARNYSKARTRQWTVAVTIPIERVVGPVRKAKCLVAAAASIQEMRRWTGHGNRGKCIEAALTEAYKLVAPLCAVEAAAAADCVITHQEAKGFGEGLKLT